MENSWLHRLDTYTNETYGRPRSRAVDEQTCVSCGSTARTFDTRYATESYARVGLCQHCQRASAPPADVVVFRPRDAAGSLDAV